MERCPTIAELTSLELTGAEKQIEWAAQIRRDQAAEFSATLGRAWAMWDKASDAERAVLESRKTTPEAISGAVRKVFGEPSAAWWIEHRASIRSAVAALIK